jgi:hypothetical protein
MRCVRLWSKKPNARSEAMRQTRLLIYHVDRRKQKQFRHTYYQRKLDYIVKASASTTQHVPVLQNSTFHRYHGLRRVPRNPRTTRQPLHKEEHRLS